MRKGLAYFYLTVMVIMLIWVFVNNPQTLLIFPIFIDLLLLNCPMNEPILSPKAPRLSFIQSLSSIKSGPKSWLSNG